jgi:pyrimidine-specific ribonucleoside hydrolase
VTGAGEAHCEPGVRNALGLLELAGYRGIPVSCGRETPLRGNHAFPTEWRTGVDSLMGLNLPPRAPSASTPLAPELLASAIDSAPEKVTLLTLGPLTNVAEALQESPKMAAKIEAVYIMGGAVDVPGNVGSSGVGIANETAEWNIYVDPQAAAVVFGGQAPVTLVPLDVTNQVPVTGRFYERLEKDHGSPEAGFVYELFRKNRDIFLSGTYYFWDSIAAAILADNSMAGFKTRSLRVVEDEGGESGRTIVAHAGRDINVAASIDAERFERELLDTLNGRAP